MPEQDWRGSNSAARGRRVDRRRFLRSGSLLGLALGAGCPASGDRSNAAPSDGEVLYNGIHLPPVWPPHRDEVPAEPESPPYLAHPPAVIPIDVGRQLFVDDFLIQSTSLTRSLYAAEYHPASPVLRPDRAWEMTGTSPAAMVYSDGVWYDPAQRLFKMWYMGGAGASTCLATSTDGIHWNKPVLDVVAGSSVVLAEPRDSTIVWFDPEDTNQGARYKLFRSYAMGDRWGIYIHHSGDGVHWTPAIARTGSCGDRSTVFWNPYRKVWVFSLRHGWGRPRRRRYWETRDLLNGPMWNQIDEPSLWVGVDRLDLPRPDLKTPPELYNLDAVAYESVMLGLFTIWRGQPADRPKPNEVCLGFSRDGYHFSRPTHEPFLPVSERRGDWNWGNVQSAGGGCLIVGDRLYFYCSGRAGVPGKSDSGPSTTGLAILRRDGFASMDADAGGGELLTRPLLFSGKRLFVNAVADHGELRAEVSDEAGRPLGPYTAARCLPFHGDSTRRELRWRGVRDLPALAGRPVRLRFILQRARLFSFWVSPDSSGASRGYVAAGGPGLVGGTDSGATV